MAQEFLATALEIITVVKEWVAENPELAEQLFQIGGIGGAVDGGSALGGHPDRGRPEWPRGWLAATRAVYALRGAMLAPDA